MEKKMRKALDNLTEQDGYHNEDVRLTYIESVVSSFKKGIYPTGQRYIIMKMTMVIKYMTLRKWQTSSNINYQS